MKGRDPNPPEVSAAATAADSDARRAAGSARGFSIFCEYYQSF
ncbi:hypothetical protein [Mycobacterium sp. IS-3022]|nr:hypothetical protein [Mycobacterium sp. IS-3022]